MLSAIKIEVKSNKRGWHYVAHLQSEGETSTLILMNNPAFERFIGEFTNLDDSQMFDVLDYIHNYGQVSLDQSYLKVS